jgi:hypothetical protein
MSSINARKGKIARLPHVIRHELNARLRDGVPGTEILAWLNDLPESQSILAEQFGGEPVKPQNLTDWRQGGYQDWLSQQDKYEEARKTTDHAQYICSSLGLDPSDALSVIITGHLVNLLSGDASLDDLSKLGPLFNAVTNVKKVGLDQRKVDQAAADLDLRQKKFQRDTAQLFVKWYKDKRAADVVENPGISTDEKTELLGQLIFAEDW